MFTLHLQSKSKLRLWLTGLILIGLMGCQSTTNNVTQTGPLMVGPSAQPALGSVAKSYRYNSNIYLNVAIPVFNPGLPVDKYGQVDYEEVDEQKLWPQLRRAEAKRFAIQTKKAMEKIGAFGAVNVVPSPNTSADIFVLGSVDYSDSERVQITATVVDSTGSIWGNKQFEHKVSKGFFRDATNKEANPYEPVFIQIADYVYNLLITTSESQKQTIQQTTEIRYAQTYSPETFNQYIDQQLIRGKRGTPDHYQFNLTGLPSEDDRMLQRINTLRTQDQMFVDRLQDQYLAFDAETEESYRAWQRETLPEVVAAREAKSDRTFNQILGGVLAVAAVAGALEADSDLEKGLTTVAGLGAAAAFKAASDRNAELGIHKSTIDEMGENLDINLSPSVMELNDKTIELTGTAGEQYEQWKAQLYKIYELETAEGNML